MGADNPRGVVEMRVLGIGAAGFRVDQILHFAPDILGQPSPDMVHLGAEIAPTGRKFRDQKRFDFVCYRCQRRLIHGPNSNSQGALRPGKRAN